MNRKNAVVIDGQFAEARAEDAQEQMPQPWQFSGQTRQEFTAQARVQEAEHGKTLVVETLVNGYQSALDGEWYFDYAILSDLRTGEQLVCWSYDDGPPEYDYDSLLLVRREVTE